MTKKLTHCSHCGKSSYIQIWGCGECKCEKCEIKGEKLQCYNSQEYLMVKKVSRIIYSADKSPYDKKIALFNLWKDLEVGELGEEEKKKIDLLLLGRVYNELAKHNLKEYKKLEGDSQNEIK